MLGKTLAFVSAPAASVRPRWSPNSKSPYYRALIPSNLVLAKKDNYPARIYQLKLKSNLPTHLVLFPRIRRRRYIGTQRSYLTVRGAWAALYHT